jgi:hypothetical protein
VLVDRLPPPRPMAPSRNSVRPPSSGPNATTRSSAPYAARGPPGVDLPTSAGTLVKPNARPAAPTIADLLSQSRLTTEEWYRSARTTRAYANYVKNGKAFLEAWANEGRLDVDGVGQLGGVHEGRSALSGAFDNISDRTPTALRLLLAYKCDHEAKGFATAEGLRSAFKLYFERCVAFLPRLDAAHHSQSPRLSR